MLEGEDDGNNRDATALGCKHIGVLAEITSPYTPGEQKALDTLDRTWNTWNEQT